MSCQVSKCFLVLKAAAEVEDVRLKWHKIVHFGTVDQPTFNAVPWRHGRSFFMHLSLI